MGKTDERLDRTRQAIERAFNGSGGYHGLRARNGWPPIRVYFGEADCCVTASFGGEFGARMELLIGVPADWLETVHDRGLALVNGAVVLQALRTPWDDPVEDSWEARVMMPGQDNQGVEATSQFVVRYGGETCRGVDLERAKECCLLIIQERLGI